MPYLSVGFSTSQIDGDGDDQTDGDPNRRIEVGPVRDEYGGGVEFGGEDDRPVVPATSTSAMGESERRGTYQ